MARKPSDVTEIADRDPRVERAIDRAQAEIAKYESHEAVSRESAIRAFQMRVRAALDEKGWNQSDLARACARITGKAEDRSVISTYLRTEKPNLPRPGNIATISRALGVDKEKLFPSRERLRLHVDRRSPSAEVKDAGQGLAWLKINQAVEWSVALEVMRILKQNGQPTPDDERAG